MMEKMLRNLYPVAKVKVKKQSCGHIFNAANCKVCPYCKAKVK